MDKTEQLADMVIQAAQVFIDRKLAPIMAGFETMKRELDSREFITKDENLKLLAGLESLLREEIKTEAKTQERGPTLEQVKDMATAASLDACSRLFESIPKPADGKSVTMAEVLPEVEKLVAAIPRPKDGTDAKPEDVASEVQRQLALIPPPKDGQSVDVGAIFSAISESVDRAVKALPLPEPGKSVTLDDVRPLIEKGVADAVAAIPMPENGRDGANGKDAEPVDLAPIAQWVNNEVSRQMDDVRPLIDKGIADAVAAIPKPQDGKDAVIDFHQLRDQIKAMIPTPIPGESVTIDDVRPVLAEMVAALPKPEDGKSVTVDDVRPIIKDLVTEMVAAIPAPLPGKDAIIDYELIESRIRENIPAPIKGDPGKDADLGVLNDMVSDKVKAAMAEFRPPEKGDPGKDAEPLDMEEVRRHLTGEVQRELAGWERPHDGEDGLGFDDMNMDLEEDGRTLVFRVSRDDREKVFKMVCPWQIFRGVYESGRSYTRGDVVTYAGSQFIAKRDTIQKPGTDDWVLSVKRGKDAA